MWFPDVRPIGDLYCRVRGRERWKKIGPAAGETIIDPGMEYRLRLRGSFYGVADVTRTLSGLDLDRLDEIVVYLPVSGADVLDEASAGIPWLSATVAREEKRIREALHTRARIVAKMRVR